MMTDTLTLLLQRLDEPAARFHLLDQYYSGDQPLSFLAPEARLALGNRLARVQVNIPRLLVDSVAERLRVVGFDGADVWPSWLASDLDQQAPVCHREALALGSCYAIVWAGVDGAPNVSVESARQVSLLTDPGSRRTVAALKRWTTATTTEATLFLPDEVIRYSSNSVGATTAGFREVERLRNPLGQVPVVKFANTARLLDEGRSEMSDVLSLSDAVVKLTTDLLVASEFTARPRRWATGVELVEDEVTGEAVNPIPEGNRAMVSETPESKFGQLPGASLDGYKNAIDVVMRQISAVSGLPEHALGIGSSNPTSADSIRASEAALTARAEARQQTFGRSWEHVARLMEAVRSGVDPDRVSVRVRWADPATRSVAQEADAIVKLHGAGILPTITALQRLGYTPDEIAAIEAARNQSALAGTVADIEARAALAARLQSNQGMNEPTALAAAGLMAAADRTTTTNGSTAP